MSMSSEASSKAAPSMELPASGAAMSAPVMPASNTMVGAPMGAWPFAMIPQNAMFLNPFYMPQQMPSYSPFFPAFVPMNNAAMACALMQGVQQSGAVQMVDSRVPKVEPSSQRPHSASPPFAPSPSLIDPSGSSSAVPATVILRSGTSGGAGGNNERSRDDESKSPQHGASGDVSGSELPSVAGTDLGLIFPCKAAGCGEIFTTRFSLKRHSKKHTGERPHICPHPSCDSKFAERSTLKRHMRIHTGEKPYRCKFAGCGKTFADRTNVKRHQMVHTGVKPYLCTAPGCDRTFSRKSYLRRHVISSHTNRLAILPQHPPGGAPGSWVPPPSA